MLQLRHMASADSGKIDELLSRGVGELIDPDHSFRHKLQAKLAGKYPKEIVIKFGVDPTRPDIHLGHAVVFRRLRQFQDLGCKVIFLVGDFTAQIGDPTGKSKVRPEVSQREIEANVGSFLKQVGKILKTNDPKLFSWIRNSDWFCAVEDIVVGQKRVKITQGNQTIEVPGDSFLGKATVFENTRMQKTALQHQRIEGYTMINFLAVLRHLTLARIIERDMFQERLKHNSELHLHELMYPVLQGIDSVVLARIYGTCDLEIGGTDQTFNMLVGRDLMKTSHQPPQAVLALKILEGLDGKEKMSKSLDNYISVIDPAAEMYGKVMSIPDRSIANYFELCTYTPAAEIAELKKSLAREALNPRDLKMRLAREIVEIYHGPKAASAAEESFVNAFQKKTVPTDLPELAAQKGDKLADVLLLGNLIASKTEWRRLVKDGAIHDLATDQALSDPEVKIKTALTLKIGKRRFVKISI